MEGEFSDVHIQKAAYTYVRVWSVRSKLTSRAPLSPTSALKMSSGDLVVGDSYLDDVSFYTCGEPPVHKEASVDIKPTTCPNALNTNDAETTTVAILGTDDPDVNNVDPNTITLQGVSAQSSRKQTIQDVAAPFMRTISDPSEATDCTADGPDGKEDLVVKFASMEVVAALDGAPALNNGDVEVLELTGKLKSEFGGTPIKDNDAVVINKNIARY